ncbi:hypothetical protein BGZ80_007008, partial [Entomortierella chlamydospora]
SISGLRHGVTPARPKPSNRAYMETIQQDYNCLDTSPANKKEPRALDHAPYGALVAVTDGDCPRSPLLQDHNDNQCPGA